VYIILIEQHAYIPPNICISLRKEKEKEKEKSTQQTFHNAFNNNFGAMHVCSNINNNISLSFALDSVSGNVILSSQQLTLIRYLFNVQKTMHTRIWTKHNFNMLRVSQDYFFNACSLFFYLC
jgi:hypothetical protein